MDRDYFEFLCNSWRAGYSGDLEVSRRPSVEAALKYLKESFSSLVVVGVCDTPQVHCLCTSCKTNPFAP